MRKIVISGATGNIGFHTVSELSKEKNVEIVALTRDTNSSKSKRLESFENVTIVEADSSKPETLISPLKGAQVAMIVSPWDNLLENEINFINASIRQGVEFLLKISTTSTMMREDTKIGYARKHLLIEKYLKETGEIAWAALRPNEFMENRLGFGQAIKHQNSFPSMQGENVSALVSAYDIGKMASLILLSENWEVFNGKSMDLSGPENVSDKNLAEVLSNKLGRSIEYQLLSEEELAKLFYGDSVTSQTVEQMKEFNGYISNRLHTVENLPTDKLLLDLYQPKMTLENFIDENIESFK